MHAQELALRIAGGQNFPRNSRGFPEVVVSWALPSPWGLQGPGPREGGAAQVASEARQLAGSDGLASLGLGLGLAGFP